LRNEPGDEKRHSRKRRLAALGASVAGAMALVIGTGTNAFAVNQVEAFSSATPDWSCGQAVESWTMELVFQCDGNLVLYRLSDYYPVWATGTNGKGITRVDFSASAGAIVLYKGSTSFCAVGAFQWDGVHNVSEAVGGYADVQDDGNFVIYNISNKAVWASGTTNNHVGSREDCHSW